MDPSKNESEQSGDASNQEGDSDEHKRSKRRSKNEVDGRTHKCKLCSKSYLSYPALYTHYKQKHNTCNTSGRGRGRPKKDTGETNIERNKFNPLDSTYFQKEQRRGTIDEFNEPIRKAFNELYSRSNEGALSKRDIALCATIEDHRFLNTFLLNSHDVTKTIENENELCDVVFMEYLNKMSVHVNPAYFTKLIVFVTLFREYLNSMNREKTSEGRDFSELSCAEDVPELSNDFINDFLDPESNDFNFTKEEAIDLTQNFCQWMYENNFTCSKLSLINNEKK